MPPGGCMRPGSTGPETRSPSVPSKQCAVSTTTGLPVAAATRAAPDEPRRCWPRKLTDDDPGTSVARATTSPAASRARHPVDPMVAGTGSLPASRTMLTCWRNHAGDSWDSMSRSDHDPHRHASARYRRTRPLVVAVVQKAEHDTLPATSSRLQVLDALDGLLGDASWLVAQFRAPDLTLHVGVGSVGHGLRLHRCEQVLHLHAGIGQHRGVLAAPARSQRHRSRSDPPWDRRGAPASRSQRGNPVIVVADHVRALLGGQGARGGRSR